MADIVGGKGKSLLVGTNDEDSFIFPADTVGDAVAVSNVILGFQAGIDHVDLSALHLAAEGVSWGRVGANTTVVTIDTIGDPAQGPELTLTLSGVNSASLDHGDFLL